MADKKTKRIIAFEAEFKNAQEVGKWIAGIEKGIQGAGNKNLDAWIREYQTKLKVLQDNMQKWEAEGRADNIAAAMHAEMRRMLPLSQKIVDTFTKMSLGDNLGEALNQAQKAVDEAEKKQKRSKRNKQNWQRKTADGKRGLSNSEIERIYNSQVAKKPLTINGKTYGGEGGLDAAQFIAHFKEIQKILSQEDSKLEKRLQDLKKAIIDREEVIITGITNASEEMKKAGVELEQAKANLDTARAQAVSDSGEQEASSAVSGQETVHNFRAAIEETNEAAKAVREEKTEKEEATKATEKYNKETKKTPSLVHKAATQVFTYGSILALFKRALSESKRTITELDQALTDMAIVTDMTREECWKMVDSMQAIAKETGTTTTQVAATTTKFLQQGKSISQATELTKAALMAASIAGIDASRSVDLLTNAMNGFQMSASQALEVSDKFAALAAASATDYEELAVALSKVAAQANLAGMSMDFTLGMLAKGIEVTREAPETIGTALKTVIARMRELTDYGETLEEGMDVNRVETALENVGVKLRDTNGQFRDLEAVLTELGGKWNTLNVNQQANVAVALAGTRQQSRLIAMMQDFDRTLELVDISTNSYGATMAQQMKYMEGLGAATNKLTTAYEGLITNLTDSELLIFLVSVLTQVVDFTSRIIDNSYILIPIVTLLATQGLKILLQKSTERLYQKEINKLQNAETKIINQKRLAEIQIRKNKLKTYIETLKNANAEEDTLENILKQAKVNAENAGDKAKAAEYAKEINDLNKDDAEEKIKLYDAEREYNSLLIEERQIHMSNVQMTNQELGLIGQLTTGTAALALNLGSSVVQFGLMVAQQVMMTRAKWKETKARLANIAAIKKETAENTKNAGVSMAGSAGKIPVVGWIIGAIILAAVAGLAIAGLASYINSANKNTDKNVDSIEGNIKAMQKLQAEMYNLGQQRKLVSGLTEEFDSLSSKINQSADDIARLEEIIKEFNDSVGADIIDSGTDSTTALNRMRGYEAYLNNLLTSKVSQSNTTLSKAINSSEDLIKYMSTSEGAAIIRQNLAQNNSAFGSASQFTQDLIMQQLAKGEFVSATGIDYDNISNIFTTDIIEQIDEALSSGSLVKYKDALESIGDGLNGVRDAAKNMIVASDGVFKQINQIDRKVLAEIDKLQLNSEALAKFAPVLTNIINKYKDEDGNIIIPDQLVSSLYTDRMKAFGIDDIDKAQDIIDAQKQENEDAINKWSKVIEGNRHDFRSELETAGFDTTGIKAKTFKGMNTFNDLMTYFEERSEEGKITADEQKLYNDMLDKLGLYQNNISNAEEAQEYLNMSITEWFNTIGNIKPLQELQDEITRTTSTIEQLSKLATGELRGSELDELLTKYPQLIKYMKDGRLSIEEYKEAQKDLLQETQDILNANLTLAKDQLNTILTYNGIILQENEKLEELTYEQLINKIAGLDQKIQDEIINSWEQYEQNRLKSESGIYSDEYWQRIGESTGLALAKAQYNNYKKELELYSTNDSGYKEKFDTTTNALITVLSEAKTNKNKIKSDIDSLVGDGIQYKIIDNEIFPIINGVATALSEIKDKAILDAFSNDMLPQLVEDYTEAEEEIMSLAQDLASKYKEEKEKELEQQQEILEKRKEAYEKYFEDVDALEEEQERAQSKQDIITQLSALSTGVDGTTKSKIKDLQSQLNDLMKEEADAQKEAVRNELLESLDDKTETLSNDIEKLDDSVLVLTRALIGSVAGTETSKFSYDNKSSKSYAEQLADWAKEIGLPGFAQGGLVKYTGLAMVHGSPNRPEAFLNADETLLLSAFIDNIMNILDSVDTTSSSDILDHSNNSVNIENITIKTEHLNNNQDFKTAGSTLAQEFAAVIRERGLNVNVRK